MGKLIDVEQAEQELWDKMKCDIATVKQAVAVMHAQPAQNPFLDSISYVCCMIEDVQDEELKGINNKDVIDALKAVLEMLKLEAEKY